MKELNIPVKLNNDGKRIKIVFRKTKNDAQKVYLSYQKMINGHRISENKSLNLSVYLKRSTRTHDIEILNKAVEIRDKIEIETAGKLTNIFETPKTIKTNNNIISLMEQLASNYKGNTYLNWDKSIKHVKKHFGDNIPNIETLNRTDVLSFANYLKSHLKPNTGHTYFQKFKQTINYAIEQQLINTNPAYRIAIKKEKTAKPFLTIDELKHLESIKPNDINVKNAFLFACYTGLRWGDLLNLKFANVTNNVLDIKMQKTGRRLTFTLPKQAIEIIESQKAYFRHIAKMKSESVFYFLPMTKNPEKYSRFAYESARNKLKTFLKSAEIKKNITFHCARHTFSAICQHLKIDLYTIKNLLGHTDIRITQVYLKDLETISAETINKISELNKN